MADMIRDELLEEFCQISEFITPFDVMAFISEAGYALVPLADAEKLSMYEKTLGQTIPQWTKEVEQAAYKRCAAMVRKKAAQLHASGKMINEAARLDSLAAAIEADK